MACRNIFRVSAISLASIAATLSIAGAEQSAEILAGYEKNGKTVSCINLRQIRNSDPIDDYAIIFETSGNKKFLNELNGRCIGLGREERFSYKTSQSQLCRGDIITVLDTRGSRRGSCSLGEFQELAEIEVQEGES